MFGVAKLVILSICFALLAGFFFFFFFLRVFSFLFPPFLIFLVHRHMIKFNEVKRK